MAWASGPYDIVSIKFYDSTGQNKKAEIRVASGTSDADVQAVIAAEQASSNASLAAYSRHVEWVDDAPTAAVPYDPAVNPLNLLSEGLELEYNCGPNMEPTRTSVLAPSNSQLIKGPRNKMILNPAGSQFTALQTAAIAAMVNTGGSAVVTLQRTQEGSRKSKLLI